MLQNYAVLDENNKVFNSFIWDPEVLLDQSLTVDAIQDQYPVGYVFKECGEGITQNEPIIGHYYDETLNAFIPPQPDPTYILDTSNWEWHPDPNLEYNIDGIGDENTLCRYHLDDKCWCIIE